MTILAEMKVFRFLGIQPSHTICEIYACLYIYIYSYLKENSFYGSIKAFLFNCAFLYDAEFGIATQNITQKNWNPHFFKDFWNNLGKRNWSTIYETTTYGLLSRRTGQFFRSFSILLIILVNHEIVRKHILYIW